MSVTKYPVYTIHTTNPDPTSAINAFLWCLSRARELGMIPSTEHILAEHLLRRDARVMFYSNAGGVMSLVLDDEAELDNDEMFDLYMDVARKVLRRRKEARAQAIEARSGETAGLDPKDESAVYAPQENPPSGETK